jgi:hypothetical protein
MVRGLWPSLSLNAWEEGKQFEELCFYLEGEIKDWCESNKKNFMNLKDVQMALMERFQGRENQSKESPSNNIAQTNPIIFNPLDLKLPETDMEMVVKVQYAMRLLYTTTPANLVYKIKENPLPLLISDAFSSYAS